MKYMELNFPELIETAKSKNDLLELAGEKFEVEEA